MNIGRSLVNLCNLCGPIDGWATIIQHGLTALMMSSRSGRTGITDILLSGKNISLDIQNVRALNANEYGKILSLHRTLGGLHCSLLLRWEMSLQSNHSSRLELILLSLIRLTRKIYCSSQ